jgi:ubiquinone/menaquinone biosynthesis C-methylase UbiE
VVVEHGRQKDIQDTFDVAAAHYDGSETDLWERFGVELVRWTGLSPGDKALDLCCGSGASALVAARAVGPRGKVLGVDLSARLLDLAREKAKTRDLGWAEFIQGDVEKMDFIGGYDVCICGLALFLFEDRTKALRRMIDFVKPGGKIAISMWGEGYWEPANTLLDRCIAKKLGIEGRILDRGQCFASEHEAASLLSSAGIRDIRVTSRASALFAAGPEAWWRIILGSGYQGVLRRLDDREVDSVKRDHLRDLEPLLDDDGKLRIPCPIFFVGGRAPIATNQVTTRDRIPRTMTLETRISDIDRARLERAIMRPDPEPSRDPHWRIEVIEGPDAGKSFLVGDGRFIIGRDAGVPIVLSDIQISRRHIELEVGGGVVRAVDLESRNGTYFEGSRVRSAIVLPGESVKLGSTVLTIRPARDHIDPDE